MAWPPVKTWVTEADPEGPPANPGMDTPLTGEALTAEFQAAKDYADAVAAAGAIVSSANTFTAEQTVPDLKVAGLTGAVAGARFVGATVSGAPTSGTFLVGDFMVDQSGAMWVCTVAGTPGTWIVASAAGVELGYAEITSAFTTTATAATDVTGLSITFTARSRPIMLRAWALALRHTVAGTAANMQIVDGTGATIYAQAIPTTPAVANGATPPINLLRRVSLTQGTSYTFKVQAWGGAAGTTTVAAGTGDRAFIQAIEV